MITNASGIVHQYFLTNPWGEEMYTYNAQSTGFDSPYRFNGKELDKETGLAYYGARYYDNELCMWLSVDMKAHWYPSMSSYNFVGNNPIMNVDPNGMWIEGAGFWRNLFNSDEKILAEDLAAEHKGAEIIKLNDGWQVNYSLNDGYSDLGNGEGQISTTESVFFSNEVDRDAQGNIIYGESTDAWSVDLGVGIAALAAGFNYKVGIGQDSNGDWFWHKGGGYSVGISAGIGLTYTEYTPYDGTPLSYTELAGEGRSDAAGFLLIYGESGGDARGRWPTDWRSEYRNPNVNRYYSESGGIGLGLKAGYSHNFYTTTTTKIGD